MSEENGIQSESEQKRSRSERNNSQKPCELLGKCPGAGTKGWNCIRKRNGIGELRGIRATPERRYCQKQYDLLKKLSDEQRAIEESNGASQSREKGIERWNQARRQKKPLEDNPLDEIWLDDADLSNFCLPNIVLKADLDVDEKTGRPLTRWASCPECGTRERILADEHWDCPNGCFACPECGTTEYTGKTFSGDRWCSNCGWFENSTR